MTEITRVPLQPIAKGSLTKIWLGVAAAALAAGGIAWAAMPPRVDIDTITKGAGPSPTLTDVALINYKGTLPDGKVFDQAQYTPMPLQGVVPGFSKALQQMQRGGKYKVVIPSDLAYGAEGRGEIPGNTDLTFEIELLDFTSRENFEQQMQMMQQMQQMQGMPGVPQGGPQGAPPAGAPQP